MIKLFWNTQNHNKPDLQDKNSQEARDYVWGIYHQKNSDKWILTGDGNIRIR